MIIYYLISILKGVDKLLNNNRLAKVYYHYDNRLFTKDNLESVKNNMSYINALILDYFEENKKIEFNNKKLISKYFIFCLNKISFYLILIIF